MIQASKRTKQRRRSVSELDRIIRKQVFERDGGRCVRCGSDKCLTPSHVLPKSHYGALRWEIDNIKTLCLHCHLHWWHLNPVEAGEWFAKTYPERWARLQIAKQTAGKINPKTLLAEMKSAAVGGR